MLALIGKSGSGKTTIEDTLIREHGFKRAISHTSREKRVNDVEGVNYYFVSKAEMERLWETGELVERVDYLDNIYGFVESECKPDRVVAVLPDGLKQLNRRKDLNIFSVYLDVSYDVRKERMSGRGDSDENVEKRLRNDDEVFSGVESIVDLVINNDDKTIEEIVNIILKEYNK
jgi:guanylate kinase